MKVSDPFATTVPGLPTAKEVAGEAAPIALKAATVAAPVAPNPELPPPDAAKIGRDSGDQPAGFQTRSTRQGPLFLTIRGVDDAPVPRFENLLLAVWRGEFIGKLDTITQTETTGSERPDWIGNEALVGAEGPLLRVPGDKMSYAQCVAGGEPVLAGWLQLKDDKVINSGTTTSPFVPDWRFQL